MNTEDTSPQNPETPSDTHRRRPWMIGLAAAGALVLVGAGVAIGATVLDDDDRETDLIGSSSLSETRESGGADDATTGEGSRARGADDPAQLIEAVEQAQSVADGVVVSVETDGQRSAVEFEAENGDETTVIVQDGQAEVAGTDRDEDVAQINGLDAESITAAFEAAVAEVSGTVLEITADDDLEAYTVDVLTDTGVVEIDLDRDFGVLAVDRD